MGTLETEFINSVKQLDECAIKFNQLQQESDELKANYRNTPEQVAKLVYLEKQFRTLAETTKELKEKINKFKNKHTDK